MTVAICLSGGGSRGDFEIGALEFLYEQGIRATIICATSVGSVNAAKLAEGEDANNPNRGFEA
jgi:NTE family protein